MRDGRLVRLLPAAVTLPPSAEPFLDDISGLRGAPPVEIVGGFGGCGKEAMLMVFRTVFSGIVPLALPRDEADRTVGTAGVEAEWCGVGKADGRSGVEGERNFVGLRSAPESLAFSVAKGRLFLDFPEGKGGRAMLGGSMGGRDRTGSDVATAIDMLIECDFESQFELNCGLERRSSVD